MPGSVQPLGGDPPIGNRFLFEVDGVEIGIFREVSGLQVDVDVEEIHEGGQNGYVRLVPGRMRWPHLIFRRGITKSDDLLSWLQKSSGEGFAGSKNKLSRCTGAVTVISDASQRLRSWEFIDVFPIRWQGPDFEATSTTPLEEELEVVHHGFRSKTQETA